MSGALPTLVMKSPRSVIGRSTGASLIPSATCLHQKARAPHWKTFAGQTLNAHHHKIMSSTPPLPCAQGSISAWSIVSPDTGWQSSAGSPHRPSPRMYQAALGQAVLSALCVIPWRGLLLACTASGIYTTQHLTVREHRANNRFAACITSWHHMGFVGSAGMHARLVSSWRRHHLAHDVAPELRDPPLLLHSCRRR